MTAGPSLTQGLDHLGLSVRSLAKSVRFFVDALGWIEKGRKPEYPAAFASDGKLLLTLWQVSGQAAAEPLDRKSRVGLHHLALKVASSDELDALFSRIEDWPEIEVEFAPELSGEGPKRHFMILEPGGNRLEFAWDPRI